LKAKVGLPAIRDIKSVHVTARRQEVLRQTPLVRSLEYREKQPQSYEPLVDAHQQVGEHQHFNKIGSASIERGRTDRDD
jgi:hypothetical protein